MLPPIEPLPKIVLFPPLIRKILSLFIAEIFDKSLNPLAIEFIGIPFQFTTVCDDEVPLIVAVAELLLPALLAQ